MRGPAGLAAGATDPTAHDAHETRAANAPLWCGLGLFASARTGFVMLDAHTHALHHPTGSHFDWGFAPDPTVVALDSGTAHPSFTWQGCSAPLTGRSTRCQQARKLYALLRTAPRSATSADRSPLRPSPVA